MLEWEIVQEVIQGSMAKEPDHWRAFEGCQALEAYTDGSAPVRNPGGPAGFSAVVVGFAAPPDRATPSRPAPQARLDLAGYIPERAEEPLTSNNRAEIAGVLAAMSALRLLGKKYHPTQQAYIWSDSQYVVKCADGTWQRKKNTDLWPTLDQLAREIRQFMPGGMVIQWVRGHAGNQYNEAADELASRGAFNFDSALYSRFRAAQRSTGPEMPGAAAFADDRGQAGGLVPEADADYALVLLTKLDGGSHSNGAIRAAATGNYLLRSKTGLTDKKLGIAHEGRRGPNEAEYSTLIAALNDIVARIADAGRSPGDYTLALYSHQELIVKQLTGEYRVKAPALQYLYAEAKSLCGRFNQVYPIWQHSSEIEKLFKKEEKN